MFSHVFVHSSIHLSVHRGEGYPGQVQPGGVPHPGPAGGTSAGGYPCQGIPLLGVPHLRYPQPCQTWLGVPCWGVPHLRYPPSDLAGGYPVGRGYPTSGSRWSTLYAVVGMPLAFTQEDFLVHSYFYLDKILHVYFSSLF